MKLLRGQAMSARIDDRHRFGFSLWDLHAVLAVGAILISMLLPALQSARGTARNTKCQNRIRNVGLACLDYEAVNGRLPAELSPVGAVPLDSWVDEFRNNQHTSIFVQLLPFMGLEGMLDKVDPFVLDFENDITDQTEYVDYWDVWSFEVSSSLDIASGLGGTDRLQVDVIELTCPSDDINTFVSHAAGMTVASYNTFPDTEDIGGFTFWVVPEGDGTFSGARTNFVGCFGASTGGDNRGGDLGAFRGAIGHREIRTLAGIPDGSSNTVLVGENIGTIQQKVTGEFERDFTQIWYLGADVRGRGAIGWKQVPPHNTTSGATGFFSILNAATPDYPVPAIEPDPRQGILGSAFHARHFGFGSMHPDGVNFVMLDGSVRQITRTDDWKTLYALFGAFDGTIARIPGDPTSPFATSR